jgi:hypothetical protein
MVPRKPYVFAGQMVPTHAVAPLLGPCVPGGQSAHVACACDVEPAGPKEPWLHVRPSHTRAPEPLAYVPEGQSVQPQLATAGRFEYEPGAHGVPWHDVEPCASVYVPGVHAVHCAVHPLGAATTPYVPGAQMVPRHAVSPTKEKVPGRHAVHVAPLATMAPVGPT